MEQDAREVLTAKYNESLVTGFQRLNVETADLARNQTLVIEEIIQRKGR